MPLIVLHNRQLNCGGMMPYRGCLQQSCFGPVSLDTRGKLLHLVRGCAHENFFVAFF